MASVDIAITASTKEAEKALKGFATQATNSLESVESAFGMLKGAALAAVAVLTTGAIANALANATKAALEQEDAVNALNAALKLSGSYTEEASKDFDNFANSIQSTLGIQDDFILKQAALVKAYGLTNDQTKKVIEAAIDLSAVTGTDLTGNIEQLAKTVNGFTSKELAKYVPAIKKMTTEQLESGKAVELVRDRFKGVAVELSQNLSGQLKRTSANFGEIQESIGNTIVKNAVVIKGFEGFNRILVDVNEALIANQGSLSVLVSKGFVVLFDVMSRGLKGMFLFNEMLRETANIAIKVADTFIKLIYWIGRFVEVMSGIVLGGPATAIAGFGLAVTKTLEILSGGNPTFKKMADSMEELTKSVGQATVNLVTGETALDKMLRTTHQGLIDVHAFTNQGMDVLSESLAVAANTSEEVSVELRAMMVDYGKVSTATKETTKSTAGLNTELEKLSKVNALDKLKTQYQDLIKALKNVGKSELQQVQETQDERLRIIKDSLQNGLITEREYASARLQINIDAEIKRAEIEKKEAEERKKRLEDELAQRRKIYDYIKEQTQAASQSGGIFNLIPGLGSNVPAPAGMTEGDKSQLTAGQVTGGILGTINTALQGASGAVDLIAGGIGKIADVFLPGIGQVVTEITKILAQGPDKVREFITSFLEAIPDLIVNILESLPVVIETLLDKLPDIIEKLIEKLPDVLERLIEKIPDILEKLVAKLPVIVERLAKLSLKLFEMSGRAIGQLLLNVGHQLVAAVGSLFDQAIKAAIDFAARIVQSAADFVVKVIQGAIDFTAKVIEGAGKFVFEILKGAALFAAAIVAAPIAFGAKLLQEAIPFFAKLAEGALNFVAKIIEGAGRFIAEILGGVGPFVGQILQAIIDGIVKAFTEVFKAGGQVINIIAGAFSQAVQSIIDAGGRFIQAVIDGAGRFITAITDAIRDALSDLTGGLADGFKVGESGGGVTIGGRQTGGGIGVGSGNTGVTVGPNEGSVSIGGVSIRLWEKGGLVPPGFNNDSFLTGLSTGEMVIPANDVSRLHDFLSQQNGQRDESMMKAIDRAAEKNVTVNLVVGERELASVMLDLNRRGFRTA